MNIERIDLMRRQAPSPWWMRANWVMAAGLVVMGGQWLHESRQDQTSEELLSPRVLAVSAASQAQVAVSNASSPMKEPPAAFDWEAIFKGLEHTDVAGVAIESFEADAERQTLKLNVTFRRYQDLERYGHGLERGVSTLTCAVKNAVLQVHQSASPVLGGQAVVECRASFSLQHLPP